MGRPQDSSAFLRGDLSAEAYHDHAVALGLTALLPELAALCPVPERRGSLLDAHRAYLASPAAQRPPSGAPAPAPTAALRPYHLPPHLARLVRGLATGVN